MKKLILLLPILLFISCASNSKKARNFMQTGEWEKAREMWMLVLHKKPADKEALEGKKVAEFRATNKYVIATRTHRERGDYRGAMESALTIHNLLKKWNSNMDPDMAKYQSKEVRALYPSYIKLLSTSIDTNLPLKASYDSQHFFPIFESKAEPKLKMTKQTILTLGQKRCREILPLHPSLAFWRQFVSKLCNYYQVKQSKRSARITEHLFSRSTLLTNVNYMPSVDISIIRNNAIEAFKESPWFHPRGQKQISMSIIGDYRYSVRNWRERRIHNYKTKDPKNKTKQITRNFSYYVNSFKQSFRISLNGKIQIENEQIQIPYQMEDSETGWSYKGNSKPYIARTSAKKTNKSKWFQNHYQEFKKMTKKSLQNQWTQRFCQIDSNSQDALAQGDYVIRCLRGQDETHFEFISSWHKNNFGINHKKMETLIGKYY